MRNHTTSLKHDLASAGGAKTVSLTPGASQETATFLMSSLPLGQKNSLWHYATAIMVRVKIKVTTSSSAAVNPDTLWKIMANFRVQSPILGELFSQNNTRGAVLGNVINPVARGYNRLPQRIAIATGQTDTDATLYYRIPFANEYLRKPHETSPWLGFLEGGTVEARIDAQTILGNSNTYSTVVMNSWIDYLPVPEAVIHTPCHWREHILPGSSTKHIIQDMGAPDGLQGIDPAKGAGLAFLAYLGDIAGPGLGGADGPDNITGIEMPFRGQPRTDHPDGFVNTLFEQMGHGMHFNMGDVDAVQWPYAQTITTITGLNDASLMFQPLVTPGRDQETSKFQTVYGAKEINLTYTSTPSGSCRFLGQYYPQFEERFLEGLAARIAPGVSGVLVSKTLNKQEGFSSGTGKMAYTRQKVVPGGPSEE
jgi:hypothetical protein